MTTSGRSDPDTEPVVSEGRLPLVVQLGFSGSRVLFDPEKHPGLDRADFESKLADKLAERVEKLAVELKLTGRHFFCGISQVAVGADFVFSEVCSRLNLPQRFFLPQHRDACLKAEGSNGKDFSEDEKARAEKLLAGENVIQERVVSHSPDRHERFHETNLEIVRVSDVVISVVSEESQGKPGGAKEFVDLAKKRDLPDLELRLSVEGNEPVLTGELHNKDKFVLPALPEELDDAVIATKPGELPTVGDYTEKLKDLSSEQANWKRKLFEIAAVVIIGAHVVATICAVMAMKGDAWKAWVPWLLVFELLFLAVGFSVHRYLHKSHSCRVWSKSRLAAELARSVGSIGRFHCYLDYLFDLPFPLYFRPLLRTLSVLHLRSTHSEAGEDWSAMRDRYVEKRLTAERAQVNYYQKTLNRASRGLRATQWAFLFFSVVAFSATLLKLMVISDGCLSIHVADESKDAVKMFLGACAIVFPVLAVAALSWAAACDLEARFHVSSEMAEFLEKQEKYLSDAASPREVARLLLETESRLLGETANWYARRSFVGVA